MSAYWPLGWIWSKLWVTNLPALSGGIKNMWHCRSPPWRYVTGFESRKVHKKKKKIKRNFNCTKTHSSVVCQVTAEHQSQKLITINWETLGNGHFCRNWAPSGINLSAAKMSRNSHIQWVTIETSTLGLELCDSRSSLPNCMFRRQSGVNNEKVAAPVFDL